MRTYLTLGRIQAQRLRYQLRIAVRRQADAACQHIAAQTLAVDQLAVVRHRHHAVCGVHDKRLAVHLLGGGRRRVACVADAHISAQLSDRLIVEYVADQTHALVYVEILRALSQTRHDSGRLLSAMLQRHQTQAHHLRNVHLRWPIAARDRPKDAALVRQAGVHLATAQPLAGGRQALVGRALLAGVRMDGWGFGGRTVVDVRRRLCTATAARSGCTVHFGCCVCAVLYQFECFPWKSVCVFFLELLYFDNSVILVYISGVDFNRRIPVSTGAMLVVEFSWFK